MEKFQYNFCDRVEGNKKKQKCLKCKFRLLKTHAGAPIFQKGLNYKLLSDPILKEKHLIWPFQVTNVCLKAHRKLAILRSVNILNRKIIDLLYK